MLTLIRGAELYAPEPLGRGDLLLGGERILAIGPELRLEAAGLEVELVEAAGLIAAPGLIDNHCHFLGGGGGGGPASRVPVLQLSQATRVGVTTLIGCLGFDNTSRSLDELVARTLAYDQEGLSAFCLVGATTEHPIPTLTGRVRRDILLCEHVIGVGEISISETGPVFDSFGNGAQYLAQVAAEAYWAGRLTGKAGYLDLQVPPDYRAGLQPVFEVVERTGLPRRIFVPSHANIGKLYFEQAVTWGQQGGYVDLSTNHGPEHGFPASLSPVEAVQRLLAAGVQPNLLLLSTDGNGGPSEVDADGNLVRTIYHGLETILETIRSLVQQAGLKLEQALPLATSNVAEMALLRRKGRLRVGADADLLLLDQRLNLAKVYARGRLMVEAGRPLVRGHFEELILSQLR
jgi:beta-aspartyl-dipeptidase (metallo-type)